MKLCLIPSSVALLPLPRIEPRKAVADRHKRLFFVVSAGVYAAAGLDMQETAFFRHHFMNTVLCPSRS